MHTSKIQTSLLITWLACLRISRTSYPTCSRVSRALCPTCSRTSPTLCSTYLSASRPSRTWSCVTLCFTCLTCPSCLVRCVLHAPFLTYVLFCYHASCYFYIYFLLVSWFGKFTTVNIKIV